MVRERAQMVPKEGKSLSCTSSTKRGKVYEFKCGDSVLKFGEDRVPEGRIKIVTYGSSQVGSAIKLGFDGSIGVILFQELNINIGEITDQDKGAFGGV